MDLADDPERSAAVIAELAAVRGAHCRVCGRRICAHEALICRCLGFLDAPRCLACLARGLEREPQALRNEVHAYLMHQTCLRQGWEWANREEGHPDSALPPCLWSAPATVPSDVEWDAGDMGCGDLVLQLRLRMQELAPGQYFALTARDPGAREDLPAWCRMTGHVLVAQSHPRYRIRHK